VATQQHFAKIARVRKRGLSLKTRTSSQTRTQTNAFNNKRKKRTLVGITTEEKEVDNILKLTPLCVVSKLCRRTGFSIQRARRAKEREGGFLKQGITP
jgi:chromosome condensin MukBEF complex kleisin-like MukF subunit